MRIFIVNVRNFNARAKKKYFQLGGKGYVVCWYKMYYVNIPFSYKFIRCACMWLCIYCTEKTLENFKTLISPENFVLDIIIITMEARPLTILLVYLLKHKLMFYMLCNFNVELETIIVSFEIINVVCYIRHSYT